MLSVHLADLGMITARRLSGRIPGPDIVPGMRFATLATPIRFHEGHGPSIPMASMAILFAGWDDGASLDRFLETDPVAQAMADGWHIRLEPTRAVGSWSPLPDLPSKPLRMDDAEPVAAVTMAHTQISQLPRFARTSGPAEKASIRAGARISVGAIRPPRFVATLSLWPRVDQMVEYARSPDGPHRAAVTENRRKGFHREEVFIRCRPIAEAGTWDGASPLAELQT